MPATPRADVPSETAPRTAPQVAPQTDRGTDTGVRTVERPALDEGDHDRFAHYVPKHELTRALVEGIPVRALCGKKWVPSRDPERYPVCPTCKELMAAGFGRLGGDDEGPGREG